MQEKQITNAIDAKRFVYGGNATFTIVSKQTQTRFTYKVKQSKTAKHVFFVSVLAGPDNVTSYKYIGHIGQNYAINAGRKGCADAISFKAFNWVVEKLKLDKLPKEVEFWHSGKCGCCGRKLTVPDSIEIGLGPICAKRFQ